MLTAKEICWRKRSARGDVEYKLASQSWSLPSFYDPCVCLCLRYCLMITLDSRSRKGLNNWSSLAIIKLIHNWNAYS